MGVMNTADALYRGWDADLVRERRDGLDAEATQAPTSSGFKAINQQRTQLLTPQSSALAPVQQNQKRRRATSQSKRRRNPAVAQYLGLGSSDEPHHLEKYAPLPGGPRTPPPKSAKMRQKRRGSEHVTYHGANEADAPRKAASQRRVSDGLRVTKPRKHATRSKTAVQTSHADNAFAFDAQTLLDGTQRSRSSQQSTVLPLARNIAVKRSAHRTEHSSSDPHNDPGDYYADNQFFDSDSHEYDNDLPNQQETAHAPGPASIFDEEDFDDDLDDEEFLELTSDMIDGITHGLPSSPTKSQAAHPTYGDEQLPGSTAAAPIDVEPHSNKRATQKFKSPTTLTTRLLAATNDIDNASARKPIVRPPFPAAVRDRSPIIGLSSGTLLRTCFRIGEVINQAHQASKTGKDITFELYARVLESERDATSQHFTFCDLFHGKPPYLKAVYDTAKWNSVQLFNYDSKRLLQQGRIGRCMGTMKREGKEWVMTVLNVYEAKFDDIDWVKGIIES